jgi:flagellin
MKELAEQAATGSYSSAQRVIMDAEFAEMADEIERIAGATAFNGIRMLNEAPSATNNVSIHVGTTSTIDIDKVDMTKSGLSIETGDGGWQVNSLTANGETATTDTWVSLTAGSSTGNTNATLTISFEDNDNSANDEADIVVTFAMVSTGATDYTLAQVVAEINAESQDLGWDTDGTDLRYDAAATYLDTTSSRYVLQLVSRDSTSDEYSLDITGIGGTDTIVGGWDSSGDVTGDMAAGAQAAGLNILTAAAATTALTTIENAISTKDTARAAFGYKMNRLESTISILDIQAENLMTAESRISDVDVATEMAALTRTQVLSQAGIAMLAQANSMPQMALSLLR